MIRLILDVLLLVFFLIPFGIPVLLMEWIIGKFNPQFRDKSILYLVKGLFFVLLFLSGVNVTVKGKENLPHPNQAVLYASNHRSYFDIVVAYTQVRGITGFVAKQEIRSVPLFGHWMKRLYCLFLDRSNPREGLKTILAAVEQVKNGKSVWICPEGTRGHGDTLLPFKEGSLKIAERSGCPIIPVALLHTDDIYENHRPFIRPTSVSIAFGQPILTDNLSREEKRGLASLTQSRVEELYASLQQEEAV